MADPLLDTDLPEASPAEPADAEIAHPLALGEPREGLDVAPREHSATQAQLRRFIKSRPYVPMHELRRRFAINGAEDEVTAIETDGRRVFIGLPDREGRMIGDLLRQGEVGVELLMDPVSPIVIGVYPMRPVPRT